MTPEPPSPTLRELRVTDPPAGWAALGFAIDAGSIHFDGVSIHLGAAAPALAIDGIPITDAIDGVNTIPPTLHQPPFAPHPNGATGIDHFVIVTPDFDRTTAALEAAGMPLKRVHDAGTFRQGFRRLGPAILELVEATNMPAGPARFWGVTLIANDLDALAARLGEHLKPIKPAVQPGRRIATLDRAAGLRTHVAFMTPERA
jgi:hypothetical protein